VPIGEPPTLLPEEPGVELPDGMLEPVPAGVCGVGADETSMAGGCAVSSTHSDPKSGHAAFEKYTPSIILTVTTTQHPMAAIIIPEFPGIYFT
jgi:hypothetical protein